MADDSEFLKMALKRSSFIFGSQTRTNESDSRYPERSLFWWLLDLTTVLLLPNYYIDLALLAHIGHIASSVAAVSAATQPPLNQRMEPGKIVAETTTLVFAPHSFNSTPDLLIINVYLCM